MSLSLLSLFLNTSHLYSSSCQPSLLLSSKSLCHNLYYVSLADLVKVKYVTHAHLPVFVWRCSVAENVAMNNGGGFRVESAGGAELSAKNKRFGGAHLKLSAYVQAVGT